MSISVTDRLHSEVGTLAFICIALGAACTGEFPPITYTTQEALIGTDFGEPLCAADLRFIDQHIRFVERALEASTPTPLEIYVYRDSERLLSICESTPFGCYSQNHGYIATLWDFVDHEIVHAVGDSSSFSFPSLFWEESAAVALSVEGTHRNLSKEELYGQELSTNDNIDYPTAGHFARWLIETRGIRAFRRASRGESLESVYGASADTLAQEYTNNAPFAYPAWSPCNAPRLPTVGVGQWHETLKFSCESQQATQFEWAGASVVRTLLLDSGTYELITSGGAGVLMVGCQVDTLSAPATPWSHGDLMNQAEFDQTAFGTFFAADEAHILDLTAGLFRLAVSSGTNDLATVSVTVQRL